MVRNGLGVGAKCSARKKVLHPSKLISERYPNYTAKERLYDLLVIRQEVKKIRHKDSRVIVFRHDDFPNVDLYCVDRWIDVTERGPPEFLFQPPVV